MPGSTSIVQNWKIRYAVDGVSFMQSVQERKNIIVEGANALMLDVNCSSYPLITSSNPTLVSIISGLALSPKNIIETIGIVKACTARVGQGAFKTEDTGDIGTKLQEMAGKGNSNRQKTQMWMARPCRCQIQHFHQLLQLSKPHEACCSGYFRDYQGRCRLQV